MWSELAAKDLTDAFGGPKDRGAANEVDGKPDNRRSLKMRGDGLQAAVETEQQAHGE